jgi:hypothetical protein
MTQEPLTPAVLFAARQLLRWSRAQLAKRTSVSFESIRAYEVEGIVAEDFDVQTVRAALETAGIEFVDIGGASGVTVAKAPR